MAAGSTAAAAPLPADSLTLRLRQLGLENLGVAAGPGGAVAYENRRYRHSAEALGRVHAAAGERRPAIERRLGMAAAAILAPGAGPGGHFRVRYPGEPGFPEEPAGRPGSPTFARADLDVGPLLDYRIGRIFNPFEVRIELQPRLRLNPWPGAAAQFGILIPLVDDYPPSSLDRDGGRVRPGRMSLDQFAWAPGAALVSVSAGYFGDHRWGLAVGASRPVAEGALLFDAQVERTGYIAFADSGTYFSTPRATSGRFGLTVRPAYSDLAVRGSAQRFLLGDQGFELEVRRSMGDFDLAYFAQRSSGESTFGIRLDLPVPPMRRAAGTPLRVQPVPRFALSFRDRSEPFATAVSGIGSREDYLRQLSRPALDANHDRYLRALGAPAGGVPASPEWVSAGGMTGFILTPWAGVMPDRGFEAGAHFMPREWAYDRRGRNDNQVYYATIGFLPRVETSMRWTRIPGYRSFEEVAPDSRLVDVDRMSSGRVELLAPRPGRPGLAAGIEDVQGTRRFHAAYAVAGLPASIFQVQSRLSMGYGFRAFAASRYVLDGVFGAFELVPTRFARLQAEFDSEKWNVSIGLSPGGGIRIRAVLLNLESPSFGAGWSHTL